FYLDEVYEDEAAFLQHCRNETIARFYELIDSYAFGPLFLFKGYRIEG
ncbi:antibiotic biosynthesis monooxygenase, partial [Pseudomonas aeruginosa]|nr:antibiotic biosynthesis monooxygenase [Pseudomonas aeruginosa]